MKIMSQMYGVLWKWDDKDTKEILGIPGRDIKTAVDEMSDSLIKSGYVVKPKASTCNIFWEKKRKLNFYQNKIKLKT